jgi:hypothetical protein
MRKMKEDSRERPRASLNAPYAWPVGVVLNLFFTYLFPPFPKRTISICTLIMFMKLPNAPFGVGELFTAIACLENTLKWILAFFFFFFWENVSQPLDYHEALSLSFPFKVSGFNVFHFHHFKLSVLGFIFFWSLCTSQPLSRLVLLQSSLVLRAKESKASITNEDEERVTHEGQLESLATLDPFKYN